MNKLLLTGLAFIVAGVFAEILEEPQPDTHEYPRWDDTYDQDGEEENHRRKNGSDYEIPESDYYSVRH
ncbi:MAG: hypothetical protein JXR91_09005 [Deltaproteobacteria bacterium]|nr:hypothetical protein [Deltaproteobacteria bacterium]